MKRKFPSTKMKRKHPSTLDKKQSEGRIKRKDSTKTQIYDLIPKKTKGIQVMIRKDGKPNCFVCYKKLHLLREFRKMKENNEEHLLEFDIIRIKVNATIVKLPSNRIHPLYRHTKCEPGSNNYKKNKKLYKQYKKTLKA